MHHLKLYPSRSIAIPKEEKSPLQEIESEQEDADAALQPYTMHTYPADFTLEGLVEKWKKKEIRKEGFQRKYVWTLDRASKLIESFLLGLPVPPVYLYKDRKDSGLLIIDGHQRLRTIVYFFSGTFGDQEEMQEKDIVPFILTGLHKNSPFNGLSYKKLEEDTKAFNDFNSSVLRSFMMQQIDPNDDTSMLEIFSRLNTGGMALNAQEIRNCVYEGDFNDLLSSLNKHASWRSIFGVKTPDKRMRDIELILRFFSLFYNLKKYEKPMKDFMNTFMRKHRKVPEPLQEGTDAQKKTIAKSIQAFRTEQSNFKKLFERAADDIVAHLGGKPFHIKRGLNAAVFDSVFTAFASQVDLKNNPVKPTADQVATIRNRYSDLLNDDLYELYMNSM